MVNPTIKQLCICQICICGEHKCNPDNPYEICSVREVNNKISTGVGDYVITNNDMISESERAERREKCRKQWQISPEALKSISNSYPKVTNPSASSIASREGGKAGGGHNRRGHHHLQVNSSNGLGQNSSSLGLNSNRKLPPIERSIESQNFDSNNITHSQVDSNHLKSNLLSNEVIEKSKDITSVNYIREGAETSCSQIMESQHRESSLIDASIREDHSISCEPEWIVSRPTKVKPTDNLKWEGPMELETTFKSTIDSSAAQRLIASRQGEGDNGSCASPMNGAGNGVGNGESDPSVPFKRRHRPKTSLKPGGEGYYSTINKESYKNFVVVDQSREQLVQDRLDALARSMDEKVAGAGEMNGPQKLMESYHQSFVSNRNQSKSRSKRSDIQPTPTRSANDQQSHIQHKSLLASKSKLSTENKTHRLGANEYQTTTKITHHVKNDENAGKASQISHGIKESVKLSEVESKQKQKKIKEHELSHGKSNSEKTKTERISTNESKTKENVINDRNVQRKSDVRSESGNGSDSKSPIPLKSGGTVPFAVPIVRPSPIRPTSSLTLNCKFKGDQEKLNGRNAETASFSEENGSSDQVKTEASHQKDGKDRYSQCEKSLKVERDRIKGSKSNPSLNNINDREESFNEDNRRNDKDGRKNDSKHKRGRSLPRNRASRNRNESHLRFDGSMDFETTTHHDFQDGSVANELARSIGRRKPHRDLFRTSSEAELMTTKTCMKTSETFESKIISKANSKSTNTMTTTYNSVFRNKLYCPVIDLTPKNPEFQYKGEAGGHHFFQPLFFTST